MSRFALLVFAFLGAGTAAALASDFTIRSNISETVELNDNYNFSSTNPSGVIGSYSTFSMSGLHQTPTTSFFASGDFSYRKLFGPGSEGITSESTGDGTSARFVHFSKGAGNSESIGGSYRRSDASVAQRADFGFNTLGNTVKGDLIRYAVDGTISRQIDARNSVNLATDYSTSTTTPSGSGTSPFSSIGASAGWSHRLTPQTSLNASAVFGWSLYDDSVQTRTFSQSYVVGLSSTFSPRLSWSVSGGMSVFRTTQTGASGTQQTAVPLSPFIPTAVALAPPQAGRTPAPVFNASLAYRLTKSTNFGLAASTGTSIGVFGELSQRSSISATIGHTINSASSISAGASYSRFEVPGTSLTSSGNTGATDLFSTNLSYSYRLAKEWFASATYIYRMVNNPNVTGTTTGAIGNNSGTVSSNGILFAVSRDLTVKP